ncbi:MAG: hypothetical protein NC548_63115 [Lachnospiraceae bacterium]|nr:hypothetical protein [Lachnospiraceae bacterium]
MNNIEFTNFHLGNFGKHESLESKLGHRVYVTGANMTGKSTVKRAIQYILGSKDENGKEITGIRPHDENGVDIDGLTTTAELTVSVDGTENTLKRVYFQKKDREGNFTGENSEDCYIGGIKKSTKKSYAEFVKTIVPNLVCMSANELLSKNTDGRRTLFEDTFSTHSNDDVIDMHPEFEELRGKLKSNTVSELRSSLKKERDGETKKGQHTDGLVDIREKVIHNIEFELARKKDIDVAELELMKNSLKEQIKANEEKQTNVDKQFAEYDNLSKGVLEMQIELSDMERKANEELIKQKRDLQAQIDEKNDYLLNISNGIQRNNREIVVYEQDIESKGKERKRLLDLYYKTEKEEFDENNNICPTCHRELPQEECKQILSDFDKKKKERLKKIQKDGSEVSEDVIKSIREKIIVLQKANEQEKSAKSSFEKEIADLEQQLSALPQSIDISTREDVKELKKQISDKEQAMKKANNGAEIKEQLKNEYEDLQTQISEVNSKLDIVRQNIEIDEKVEELRKQQRKLSQDITNIDRELDLLKQFERKKAELLEIDVNKNFDFITVRMFVIQANGELKDVCEILVDGESYDRNLNFSNRLLAEVDICRGFQKKFDVQLPVILDNCESVNDFRLPQIPNQMIIFKCTEEPQLTIKSLEW